jgi:hypothetical protein
MSDIRKKVVKLATDFYSRSISYDEFMLSLPETGEDKMINELVDLIEHEPRVGRLFGVRQEEHVIYMERIKSLIQQLSE